MTMTVIDTNSHTSDRLDLLKAKGVTAVGRYYSSSGSKRLTPLEARALDSAGLAMFTVFENDGDPELTEGAGVAHAQIAVTQARAVGQPEGSAIYFALEHLPNGYATSDLPGVRAYAAGLKNGLSGHFKLGIYSDGVVCNDLLNQGLCDFTWLSASRGFAGSKSFYASKRWSLAQDPHVGQDWDGLSIDLNEAAQDFGGFRLSEPAVGKVAGPAGVAAPRLAIDPHVVTTTPSEFAVRARDAATTEWTFFGGQSEDLAGMILQHGRQEGDPGYFQRVGTYWLQGTNTHGLDGRNHDHPWSAAFISYVMQKAGAGNRFRYSVQHSVYIAQGIRDCADKRDAAGYWTMRLEDVAPQVGDLICWSRQDGVDYDHQLSGNYKGHTDLVTDVLADRILVIGGNVSDSVTKRPFQIDAEGLLTPVSRGGETLFAVMRCRL